MRTRQEIENSEIGRSGTTVYGTPKETLILEVLLDIRDTLTAEKEETKPEVDKCDEYCGDTLVNGKCSECGYKHAQQEQYDGGSCDCKRTEATPHEESKEVDVKELFCYHGFPNKTCACYEQFTAIEKLTENLRAMLETLTNALKK